MLSDILMQFFSGGFWSTYTLEGSCRDSSRSMYSISWFRWSIAIH